MHVIIYCGWMSSQCPSKNKLQFQNNLRTIMRLKFVKILEQPASTQNLLFFFKCNNDISWKISLNSKTILHKTQLHLASYWFDLTNLGVELQIFHTRNERLNYDTETIKPYLDTHTWPVSWATTNADENPSSKLSEQLRRYWHIPATWAYPASCKLMHK